MRLDDRAVHERHDRIARAVKVVRNGLQVEMLHVALLILQPEQELGAVAELQLAVLGKSRNVNLGGRLLADLLLVSRNVACERLFHTLGNVNEARAAAVDNARLLQHRQKVRSPFKRGVKLRDKVVKEVLERGFVIGFFVGVRDRLPENRQNRAFDRLLDRLVGLVDAALESVADCRNIRVADALKTLRNTCKNLRKNRARVSSCTAEHACRDDLGGFSEVVGFVAANAIHARLDRHEHVVARVPVGNREDVEVVDDVPLLVQHRSAALDHLGIYFSVQCGCGHTRFSPDCRLRLLYITASAGCLS